MKKPWFLRLKKLGDYSHLRRNDFNELREIVADSVNEYADRGRKQIRAAAIIALTALAIKHNCSFDFDVEGGHICIYRKEEPVFALRIGSYARHRVEDLLKGRALYRGILDIVPSTTRFQIPNGLSPKEKKLAIEFSEIVQEQERLKVLYYLLPTRNAGRWKNKEAIDLVDVLEFVKKHPDSSGRYIQRALKMSPNKTVRLLNLLRKRRILHRRGASKSTGWYLN